MKRYHTFPILGEQVVGHHTHNMLSMLFVLHSGPSITLIKAVHYHDKGEYRVGDAPSPALKEHPRLGEAYEEAQKRVLWEEFGVNQDILCEDEACWLHALDKLEAYFFAIDQLQLGNQNAREIILNLVTSFQSLHRNGNLPQPVKELLEDEWSRYSHFREIWPSAIFE